MTQEQIESNKELILTLLNSVERDGMKELIEWLEQSDFFTAPASTKYHGNYEGGLAEHSINVFNNLCGILKQHNLPEPYRYDTVIVSSLLHDLCKVNFYKKGTRNVKENGQWVTKETWEIDEKFPCGDHSDKSIIIIQQFIKLKPEEILAIRSHMGAFDSAVKGGSGFLNKIFDCSKLAVCLHLADMMASYLDENREE